jgi:hypothetical protein
MTAEQFEKMAPEWIKRTIGIDLVSPLTTLAMNSDSALEITWEQPLLV